MYSSDPSVNKCFSIFDETMDEILFLMIMILIWVVYYILIYINNKTYSHKTKNYDSLVIVHHNCYSFNAQNIYLIKLFYGKAHKKFFFWTNIVMDFLDDRDETYLTISIPPRVLFESQKYSFSENRKKKERFMAFILQVRIRVVMVVRVGLICSIHLLIRQRHLCNR